MGHWALVKLGVRVLPGGKWRNALIEHVDGCPSCRARLVGRDEARSLLVQAEDVGGPETIWLRIDQVLRAESVASEKPSTARAPARRDRASWWRWAAAAGGIGFAAAIVFFIAGDMLRRGTPAGFPPPPALDSLRIISARVAGRPADIYVVHVPEGRMNLVWMESQQEKGERS